MSIWSRLEYLEEENRVRGYDIRILRKEIEELQEAGRRAFYGASIPCDNCGRCIETVIPTGTTVEDFSASRGLVCSVCGYVKTKSKK